MSADFLKQGELWFNRQSNTDARSQFGAKTCEVRMWTFMFLWAAGEDA